MRFKGNKDDKNIMKDFGKGFLDNVKENDKYYVLAGVLIIILLSAIPHFSINCYKKTTDCPQNYKIELNGKVTDVECYRDYIVIEGTKINNSELGLPNSVDACEVTWK